LPSSSPRSINRDEAIRNHWTEIKKYLNASETLEACATATGSCYDLDAEISRGNVELLHFRNGGSQRFSADIDVEGEARDVDSRGDYWNLRLDMRSPVVDKAIRKWAQANRHLVE
jgi:hypothetical protein